MLTLPSYQSYLDAKSLLLKGELVAFPTETVYGLGANALDAKAVEKIFVTKGRPNQNPIIVHVGTKEEIAQYAIIENSLQQTIIDRFMPGPITLLLAKRDVLPDVVTAGRPLVGIRIPSHPVALDLLRTCQLPLAAPSANRSTKPSPTTAEMVQSDYPLGEVPMILDGGACEVGIESTVVQVVNDHEILITRPGFISLEDLREAFPDLMIQISYAQKPSEHTPGNRFLHYSPQAKVQIIDHDMPDFGGERPGTTIGIFSEEFVHLHVIPNDIQVLSWGTEKNLISCAQRLFALYHEADTVWHADHILIHGLVEEGLGYALMNRIRKSAHL